MRRALFPQALLSFTEEELQLLLECVRFQNDAFKVAINDTDTETMERRVQDRLNHLKEFGE